MSQPIPKEQTPEEPRFFPLFDMLSQLHDGAQTMLRDLRMVDDQSASCRLVRVYRPLPLHFHRCSSENVYVLTGQALFQLGTTQQEIGPGMFVQFRREAVHGILRIDKEPLIILTIDTPRRPVEDVTFLDPCAGDAHSFDGA